MNKHITVSLIFLMCLSISAQTINLSGKVTNKAAKPVTNAIVTLLHQGLTDTTGTDGSYTLTKNSIAVLQTWVPQTENMTIENGMLQFALSNASPVKIDIYDLQGNLLKQVRQQSAPAGTYHFNITENCRAATVLVINACIGQNSIKFRYFPFITGKFIGNLSAQTTQHNENGLAKVTEINDTLTVNAPGFKTKTVAISSYSQTINVTLDSATGNANLVSIEITTGTHNSKRPLYQSFNEPTKTTFDPAHMSYAAVVYACNSITVKATAEDAAVTSIVINDGDGAHTSGVKTKSVNLSAGIGKVTPVTIAVTGKDGSTVKTYTIEIKLLNIDEFHWGIYAPIMSRSLDKWNKIVPSPALNLDTTINGYVSGTLVWTLTAVFSIPPKGNNKMVLSKYIDGNDDHGDTLIYTPYNDNCGTNAQDGFVVDGLMSAIVTTAGDGTQTGGYTLSTPWGDSIGTIALNYVLKAKKTVMDPTSYAIFTYMGIQHRYDYISDKANFPYPFKTGYDWNTSWDGK